MKVLLSFLLSIILLQSQVYALSGGPDYTRGAGSLTNVVGTYGGVMVEEDDAIDNTNGGSVAVYSVDIAQSGTSTGTLLVFNTGRVFPGTITGVGDPTGTTATFKAIIEASFNYTLNIQTSTGIESIDVTSTANGTLNTELLTVRTGAVSNVLMTGTATMNISNGGIDDDGNVVVDRVIEYSVSGYRQSTPTTTAT